ncbi:MAG: hypothetical protein WBA57_16955 [Elainellaceae cyanobacterium]
MAFVDCADSRILAAVAKGIGTAMPTCRMAMLGDSATSLPAPEKGDRPPHTEARSGAQ